MHQPDGYIEEEQYGLEPSTSNQMPSQSGDLIAKIPSSNMLTVQTQRSVDEESDVHTDLIDIRKRAHSLGSRSW
jgi:hypothetical protein